MSFNKNDWNNWYKLTIDSSKVDEDLTDFPVSIVLSSGTGQTSFDVSDIFDELTVSGSSYINRKKIAITTTISGVETELYTEIANWNSASGTASLWTKVPTIVSGTDTELMFYYDATQSGTEAYVGEASDFIDYEMVINIGAEGTYDTVQSNAPCVIKESSTSYKMWYCGYNGSNQRIIYCTSTNGTVWTNHQMVVDKGAEGTYDANLSCFPSVIKESDTSYKMWYSGHDGTNWRIIYCTSTNGTTWTNHQMVVSIGAEGTYDTSHSSRSCVIRESSTSYKMWYSGHDGTNWRIIYCTSTNGTTWTNHQMVVDINSEGTYDTNYSEKPFVVKESNTSYKMWYSGRDSTNFRIIYCTSTNGTTWTNHQMVIDKGSEGTYDTTHACYSSVVKDDDNKYQMWYAGYNGSNYRILYTESYFPTWDRTVSQEVWSNNFTGVWHMEQDPSGGSNCILDSTLNENHNTSYGSMTSDDLVPGLIGNNLDYDGSDDRIKPVNDYGVSSTDLIFVEASFKTTVGNYQCIIARYQGVAPAGYYGWLIRIDPSGYLLFNSNCSQTTQSLLYSNNTINSATWYNVSISKPTGNSVTQEMFVDGVKQTQTGTSQTGSTHSNHVTIGRDDYNNDSPFAGMIDEVRFSNVIRSDAWVKTNNDSLMDNLITFAPGTVFLFFNPFPSDSSIAYNTSKNLKINVTVTGTSTYNTYDAEFYNSLNDSQISSTVSGVVNSAQASVYMSTPSGIEYGWYVKATSSGEEKTSDIYTFDNRFLCHGWVEDQGARVSGIPIRLYRRSTGELIGSATTTGTAGSFDIESLYNEYHYSTALYDSSDTNALIYDWIIPE